MELRHLRYFVAVGQALNFTKAAMRLHLAQPALSRQVSDLEDELGVDLLKRTSHGVVLTAEGKLFLEATRGILERGGFFGALPEFFRGWAESALWRDDADRDWFR